MWRKKAGATSFLSLRMKDFIQILIVAGLPLICALLEPPGKCCTLEEYLIRKSKGVAIILPTYYTSLVKRANDFSLKELTKAEVVI